MNCFLIKKSKSYDGFIHNLNEHKFFQEFKEDKTTKKMTKNSSLINKHKKEENKLIQIKEKVINYIEEEYNLINNNKNIVSLEL